MWLHVQFEARGPFGGDVDSRTKLMAGVAAFDEDSFDILTQYISRLEFFFLPPLFMSGEKYVMRSRWPALFVNLYGINAARKLREIPPITDSNWS